MNNVTSNTWNLLSVCYVPGTLPNALYEFFHVILTATPYERY